MIICITGPTFSGKHTFGKFLAEVSKGEAIDADKIAHGLYAPHTPMWEHLIESFGKEILDDAQRIDREKLGNIVFQSKDKLAELNELVHPSLHQAIEDIIKSGNFDKPRIVVAALIKELDLRVDFVISVKCTDKKKLERAGKENVSKEWVKNTLAHQKNTEDYDFEVINNGSFEDLVKQAKDIWKSIQEEEETYREGGGES